MSACPHYLELPTGVPEALPQIFGCERELGHGKRHRCWDDSGTAVGPRPRGGKARKTVQVLIGWER